MDKLAIFGVPRSGTSWLGQIFNGHPDIVFRFQPLFSHTHKGKLTPHSTCHEINAFFDELTQTKDAFVLMNTDIQRNYPVFAKSKSPTHLVFKETRYLHIVENLITKCPGIKVIGIVRNPLSTIASWILAPKEFNPDWDILREWRQAPSKNQNREEEFYGFEKWKICAENFIKFKRMYPDRFYLVRYNELKKNPMGITKKLFQFCNIEVHRQVEKFIEESQTVHDDDPYSVFRCKANDDHWLEILPAIVAKEIQWELKGTPLHKFIEV